MEKNMKIDYVEESSVIDPLDYIFNPRSVAVIGASNKIGTWGFGVMGRLIDNPERKVYPVNLKAKYSLRSRWLMSKLVTSPEETGSSLLKSGSQSHVP